MLTGLVPGRYKVGFDDPGCSYGPVNLAAQWFDQAGDRGSATVITVRAGHTRGHVNAALGLDGTVTGTVDGPGSSPLTGICVSAVPVSPYLRAVYAVTGKGRYTPADLNPGRYRIEFQSRCGLTGMATQCWQGAASKAAATVITVGVSYVVAGIDATMKA